MIRIFIMLKQKQYIMRKIYNSILAVFAFCAIAVLSSCEGPAGPSAAATCNSCHNEKTEFTLKQTQFNESAHAKGTYYSRGGECSGCHSTEGFLARKEFTAASDIYDLALTDQTPISCRTCHNVHYAYDTTDFALSISDAVTETLFGTKSPEHDSYAFGDYGASNQCLQCHQSRDRGDVPSTTSTDIVEGMSSHLGPHYGVQGNVLHAQAGVHIAGDESYPSAPNGHANLANACVNCHMYENDHRLDVNFNACVDCHSSADNAEEMVASLEQEVHDLLFELGAALAAKGVMKENTDGDEITGYSPAGGDVAASDARGVWNYMVVYQDHSYGVHNPSYIKALLKNSIAAVK